MNTELTIITPTDLQDAGGILRRNISYVEIYKKSHDKLLARAEKDGVKLSPETDKAINDWLVSAKLALKKMEEDRKPYTSKAQEFVKLFTTAENQISKDMYNSLQSVRDASVAAYAKEEEEKRRQEEKELRKKQERIELLSQAEQQVREAYAAILRDKKNNLLTSYEKSTPDTIGDLEYELKNIEPIFHFAQWEAIKVNIKSDILDKRELDNIVTNSKLGKFDKCSAHFKSEVKNYANHLLSLIPARREAFKRGEASAEAEALRRKQEALQAEAERAAKAKAEAEKAEKIMKEQLALQIEQANRKEEAPKARTIDSYSITVTEREGWMAIFQFYFLNSNETDLGKIKLDQMKAFAEKQAKKTGEMIEHPGLNYEIKYKAVAAKRKEASND